MKRKLFLILLALLVLLAGLILIVAVPVNNDLDSVRERLENQSVSDLGDADVAAVREDIQSALDRIHSLPGRILGVVPILSSNLEAVEEVAEAFLPALDTGVELRDRLETLEESGVIEDGRIDIEALQTLQAPLEEEIDALERLEAAAVEGRSGLNVPAVWNALSTLSERVAELKDDAQAMAGVLEHLDGLLGANEKRTYLVMLLNNSELRGAGGVMTGIGTLTVKDGEMDLGDFNSVHDLRGEKIIEVPAPPEYERRYGVYLANTTVWLNTPYSPHVPDDALVASRLYEKVTGIKTDGAIVADPRGIAALLPEDARIPVPESERLLRPAEVPGFIYHGAYQTFDDQILRRNALIGVGQAAFEIAMDEGLRGREVLEQAGHSVNGGHLRVISFDEDEQAALEDAEVAGELPDPGTDGLMVIAQNRGDKTGHGSKLDYWSTRKVGHQCDVGADMARCVTSTTLENIAPKNLTAYAAGIPYGFLITFLETYVPKEADITGVELDNEPARYFEEPQGGWTSVATDIVIPRGEESTVEVAYDLPIDGSYALTAAPQPLAKDAAVEIVLRLPQDWITHGPGRREDEIFRYEGPWDEPMFITAAPDDLTGLPAFWRSLVGFWREPLF